MNNKIIKLAIVHFILGRYGSSVVKIFTAN